MQDIRTIDDSDLNTMAEGGNLTAISEQGYRTLFNEGAIASISEFEATLLIEVARGCQIWQFERGGA